MKRFFYYILCLSLFACHQSDDAINTDSATSLATSINFHGQMIKDLVYGIHTLENLNYYRSYLDTTDQIDSIQIDSNSIIYTWDTTFQDSVIVNDSLIDSIRTEIIDSNYALDTFFHIDTIFYTLTQLDTSITSKCTKISIQDSGDYRYIDYGKIDSCELTNNRNFNFEIIEDKNNHSYQIKLKELCFYSYCLSDSIEFQIEILQNENFEISIQYNMISNEDTIALKAIQNINLRNGFENTLSSQQIEVTGEFDWSIFEGSISKKLKLNYNCDQIKEGNILYIGEGNIEKELLLNKTSCLSQAKLKIGDKAYNIYYLN
jgi:hypothetical protein